MLSHFSHIRLFVAPWTVAHQAPLSMGFPRQEYWSGLPFPSPGDMNLFIHILYLATYLGICLPTHLHIWDRSGKEMAHDCRTWQVQNPWVRVPGNPGRVYVLQFWGSISSSLGNFSLCSQGLQLVGEACLSHGGFLWVLQRSRTNRLVGWVGESGCVSHSVVSDSLWPHGLSPIRLLCPWNSPGKNTRVGCHFLLQKQ